MLPGLSLKGKYLCHITIRKNWDVRVNIHDGIYGRGVCLLAPHAHFTSMHGFTGMQIAGRVDSGFLTS